jgi:16S rRNA (cytosine1407-C5)-methyltransferase
VQGLLLAQGYVFAPEPFSSWAYRLVEEPKPLGGSIAAAFGLIYIQDRSSMLAPLFLDPPRGDFVLDMCASPGSKTGFLAQIMGPAGFVLANEPNERRLATLRHNLAAMNLSNVATCCYQGQTLPLTEAGLTHIQLDPPCSGWGTVERNPRIREIWPEHKVKPLLELQRGLLRRAAKLLAPEGRLLYSTCTTNSAENQDQVQWAIDVLGLSASPLPSLPGIANAAGAAEAIEKQSTTKVNPWLQVDPGVFDGQGFFFAALTKPSQCLQDDPVFVEQSPILGQKVDVGMLAGQEFIAWQNLPPGHVVRFGDKAFFLHEQARKLPGSLRWQGFELGRMVGNALRLKTRLRGLLPDFTHEFGLDLEDVRDLEALLQGRSLPLPAGMDHVVRAMGAVGLYWRGLPLGWLTVKKGRCLWSPR